MQRNLDSQTPIKTEALYIDKILDITGVNNYMVIGLVGNHPYGFTKHSPLGPHINSDHHFCWTKNIDCSDIYIDMLNKAQIVLFQNLSNYSEDNKIKAIKILEEEFTLNPWEEIADIPVPENIPHIILFRKK